jgi:hypothetical protein
MAVISVAIAMIVVLLGTHRFFFSGWSSDTVRSSQDGRSFGGHQLIWSPKSSSFEMRSHTIPTTLG